MQVDKQANLQHFNTLQLGSVAELLVNLQSEDDLQKLLSEPQFKKIPLHILGGGSNLVLPSLVKGLVVKVSNKGRTLVREGADAWYVSAQAGEVWHEFVRWTLLNGYWGLENLSLIPGTVGASPIQNIGAYGVEIKDFLWSVTCFDLQTGEKRIFSNSECQFSYRDSFFKHPGSEKYLVWEVTFRLPKENKIHLEYGDIKKELERRNAPATPLNISDAVIHIRQTKLPDPQVIGNAGSFFKNPVVTKEQRDYLLAQFPQLVSYPYSEGSFKLAAGWLIDRAGWKGKKLGPVGMFEKQALVLVNHGGASAVDVWKLSAQVISDVKSLFGVELEAEPVRW